MAARTPGYEINPPIRVPHEIHQCWLSSIQHRNGKDEYEFALTFKPGSPAYGCYAAVKVPNNLAPKDTIEAYDRMLEVREHYKLPFMQLSRRQHGSLEMPIIENEGTKGLAYFREITNQEEQTQRWARKMNVHLGEERFEGVVWMPFMTHAIEVEEILRRREQRTLFFYKRDYDEYYRDLAEEVGLSVEVMVYGEGRHDPAVEVEWERDVIVDAKIEKVKGRKIKSDGTIGQYVLIRLDIDGTIGQLMDGEIDKNTRRGLFEKVDEIRKESKET